MKTDKELLELAAIAAGIGPVIGYAVQARQLMIGPRNFMRYWAPLDDDGDALRLAVKLGILFRTDFVKLLARMMEDGMEHGEATRRAITTIAAAIGEQQNELSREA